jgi:hypothetical protein
LAREWSGLSQIAAGASATLLGLLFVAVQLNRDRLVRYPRLKGRALEAVLIFLLPLIAAILLAIPGQSIRVLGAELAILAVVHWVALAINRASRIGIRDQATRLEKLLRIVSPGFLIGLLALIAGAVLLSGRLSGLYWLVATIIVAMIGGIADAWILLVADPGDGRGAGRPSTGSG